MFSDGVECPLNRKGLAFIVNIMISYVNYTKLNNGLYNIKKTEYNIFSKLA